MLYYSVYNKVVDYSICLHRRYMRYQGTLRPYLIRSLAYRTNVTMLYYSVCGEVIDYSICLHRRYIRYQGTLRPYLIRSLTYRDNMPTKTTKMLCPHG